jgi:aquaporin related protein
MAGPGIKERLGVEEISRGIWKALLAEFLGNLLLNFFGCASCTGHPKETLFKDITNTLIVALTFGLVIMVIVQVRKTVWLTGH